MTWRASKFMSGCTRSGEGEFIDEAQRRPGSGGSFKLIGEIYNAVVLTCFGCANFFAIGQRAFAYATGEGVDYLVSGIGLAMIAVGRMGMSRRGNDL